MFFEIDNSVELGSTRAPKLKANAIHEVQLKEIKAEDLIGKDEKTYPVIYLKFENSNAEIYEHRFFAPTATEAVVDGKFGSQPSDLTQFRYSIQHLIEVLNPNLHTQIKAGKKFSLKTWAEMRAWVVKALSNGLLVDTEIKLIADSKGYATLPKYPVGATKTGDLYMKTRFIGPNLTFTAYEKKAIEAQEKAADAKPSSMADVSFKPEAPKVKETDDFDI